VIRPFDPATDDEISLEVDDVAQVDDHVHRKTRDERYWVRVLFDGRTGLFPRSNVADIPLTEADIVSRLQENGRAFVAKETFPPQEASDLEFSRGCIIIGTKQVYDNWWQGWILFDSTTSSIVPSTARKT